VNIYKLLLQLLLSTTSTAVITSATTEQIDRADCKNARTVVFGTACACVCATKESSYTAARMHSSLSHGEGLSHVYTQNIYCGYCDNIEWVAAAGSCGSCHCCCYYYCSLILRLSLLRLWLWLRTRSFRCSTTATTATTSCSTRFSVCKHSCDTW
jgi:hypothetical protein